MSNMIFVDHTSKLGGGELALSRYLKWQDKACTVDLIVFDDGELADIARVSPGVTVHVIKAKSKLQRVIELSLLLQRLEGIVVANSLSSLIHLSPVPQVTGRLVYYLRHEAFTPDTSAKKKIFMKNFVFPRCIGFLANSQYTLETLELPRFIRRGRVVYTVSGTKTTDNSQQIEPIVDKLRILSLSRLTPWKGVHYIVEAVNKYNRSDPIVRATLTVAGGALFGEEEYEASLKRQAENDEAVTFVGNVRDIYPLLQEHDILVSASIKPEPFGQILVQGQSSGLMTIATNQGGAKEIVTSGETGVLVGPASSQELVVALQWVAENAQQVQNIRKNGKISSQKFNDDKTLLMLEQALLELV